MYSWVMLSDVLSWELIFVLNWKELFFLKLQTSYKEVPHEGNSNSDKHNDENSDLDLSAHSDQSQALGKLIGQEEECDSNTNVHNYDYQKNVVAPHSLSPGFGFIKEQHHCWRLDIVADE